MKEMVTGAGMPKVYIIIINWNGLDDTLECLDSVYQLEYFNFEVIVVDNCSSDDSVVTIPIKFPRVTLIRNSKNLGFTGGNNVAMRHAVAQGADYVWLLNNDTVVRPDSLSKLVEGAEQSPDIGLASPLIYHYDTPDKIQFMGARADFAHFSVTAIDDPHELDRQQVQHTLTLWGTALLIKRSVIETIGYLSDKYFAYVEDRDYSLRALRADYRNIVRPDAHIFHKGSKSTGHHSPIQVFLGTRNLYFVWRDNTLGYRRVFVPGYYIGMVINYASCLAEERNKAGFDACLNGCWAAFRGKGGGYDPTIVMPWWLKKIFIFSVACYPHFWVRMLRLDLTGIIRTALAKVQLKFPLVP